MTIAMFMLRLFTMLCGLTKSANANADITEGWLARLKNPRMSKTRRWEQWRI
jgi:hypothetical protein